MKIKISGRVVKGESRGKLIGFPTANVLTRSAPNGVYAVRVAVGGRRYDGVANIGYAPTFGRRRKMLEVHIFNFSKDIEGKAVHVEIVKKMRNEKKFASAAALKKQIRRDARMAKAILKDK